MQLGTKGRYAVISMLGLYEAQQTASVISLSLIAEKENISVPYLEQLFAKLRQAGLIESFRGSNGGYRLAKSPKDISIGQIIRAAEENILFTRCGPKTERNCTSTGTVCKTHHLWDHLTQNVMDFLDNISLEDVATGALSYSAERAS